MISRGPQFSVLWVSEPKRVRNTFCGRNPPLAIYGCSHKSTTPPSSTGPGLPRPLAIPRKEHMLCHGFRTIPIEQSQINQGSHQQAGLCPHGRPASPRGSRPAAPPLLPVRGESKQRTFSVGPSGPGWARGSQWDDMWRHRGCRRRIPGPSKVEPPTPGAILPGMGTEHPGRCLAGSSSGETKPHPPKPKPAITSGHESLPI